MSNLNNDGLFEQLEAAKARTGKAIEEVCLACGDDRYDPIEDVLSSIAVALDNLNVRVRELEKPDDPAFGICKDNPIPTDDPVEITEAQIEKVSRSLAAAYHNGYSSACRSLGHAACLAELDQYVERAWTWPMFRTAASIALKT